MSDNNLSDRRKFVLGVQSPKKADIVPLEVNQKNVDESIHEIYRSIFYGIMPDYACLRPTLGMDNNSRPPDYGLLSHIHLQQLSEYSPTSIPPRLCSVAAQSSGREHYLTGHGPDQPPVDDNLSSASRSFRRPPGLCRPNHSIQNPDPKYSLESSAHHCSTPVSTPTRLPHYYEQRRNHRLSVSDLPQEHIGTDLPPAYSETLESEQAAIANDPPDTATSRLRPRAAVILGLNKHWHKWLYFCRLLSVTPELRFGIPMLWQLLWFLLGDETVRHAFGSGRGEREMFMVFVQVVLSSIWCAVAGYLSFFSMDCLMVRWLFHYSPIAAIIRLITASLIYYVGKSCVLEYSGGARDVRNLLPSWILIATAMTAIYLFMHDRAAIKREDRSLPVFGTASFFTMCIVLGLFHMQSERVS